MRKKPVQQRSRLLVAAILEAAGQVIAREGLDALTTNRVAEVAGISNGSLYQYFYDRADLIEALLEKVGADATQMFKRLLSENDTSDLALRDLLRAGISLGFAFLRSNALYTELIRNWPRLPIHRLLDPIEQYFLSVSQFYLMRHVQHHAPNYLQTKLYVLINSAIFTGVRFLSQESPLLKEADVIDCLADTIALSLEAPTYSHI